MMMRNVTRALLVAAAVAPFVAGARVPEFRCRGLTRSAASGGVRPLGAAASGGGGEGGDAFSLASVRASLIRQEETIIFNLIERTQFAANGPVYAPLGGDVDVASVVDGRLGAITGASPSFLDVMLFETEQVHARARRYLSPEEHPFFPENVADAALEPLDYGDVLYDDGQNVNAQIRDAYLQYVLPRGCAAGDDGQHGSCVVADVTCLQSLSRRVHFGKFVAESKLAEDGAAFAALAAAGDIAGIHAKLENVAVEDAVVRLLFEVPLPPPGRPRVQFRLTPRSERPLGLRLPALNELPLCDCSMEPLFRALSAKQAIALVALASVESPILLVSL